MGDAVTFLALADRCEREEASRELDAAIFRATGWEGVNMAYVPHLTSSLDAAVTLVLPEHAWSISQLQPQYEACVSGIDGRFLVREDIEKYSTAKTAALALCAAALRARAATQAPEEGE